MGIGSVLLQRGLISRAQLEEALGEQRRTGERLDRLLVRMAFVTREQVLEAIGEQFHMPVVDLTTMIVEPKVLEQLPARLVHKQSCVPIAQKNGTLTVATSDPFEISVLDELRLLAGCSIELVLADEEDLNKFIRLNYGVGSDTLDEMSAGLDAEVATDAATAEELEQAQEASVIKLVNDIIIEAVTERATDVHIEPYEKELVVRYRVDGVLQRANVPATINRFANAIISRMKIMANMNIAEKRKPQDGRITFRHRTADRGFEEYDLRVSIIPMLYGEGVVLRILNKSAVMVGLNELGMPGAIYAKWDEIIHQPHGIVLVTGPTGSGKSTTLYASLCEIISDTVKVITVEDPVEYHVQGVNQIQVNDKVGLSFAAGLRSILRHDPDVVMIGEIRDQETAEIAVQASLTGHLVFSTLHTNDATGAITRLLDMGVEPFLVSSSVEAVIAQRLVRRICTKCTETYTPGAGDVPPGFTGTGDGTLNRGRGCRSCRNSGYHGRIGIYELFSIGEDIRQMILERTNAQVLAKGALERGDLMRLVEDGYAKVRAGITTLSEVQRAIKA